MENQSINNQLIYPPILVAAIRQVSTDDYWNFPLPELLLGYLQRVRLALQVHHDGRVHADLKCPCPEDSRPFVFRQVPRRYALLRLTTSRETLVRPRSRLDDLHVWLLVVLLIGIVTRHVESPIILLVGGLERFVVVESSTLVVESVSTEWVYLFVAHVVGLLAEV